MIVGLAALRWECATLRNHLQHIHPWKLEGGWAAWAGEAGIQSVGVVRCGMGPARAELAARTTASHPGVTALLSFGCAGGLYPALRPGTIVVAERVVDAVTGAATPTAEPLRDEIAEAARVAGLVVQEGTVVSTPIPLLTRVAKERAARSFSAVAVDMETMAIASVASSYQLPFACVRAVLDPLEVELPADDLIEPAGGRLRPTALLRILLQRPKTVRELSHLKGLQRVAVQSLDRLFAAWVQLLHKPRCSTLPS